MKLERSALIAEVVGGAAVVIGLVFVGAELRQSNHIQRVTATQTLAADYRDSLEVLACESEAACFYARGINGLDNLTSVEGLRFFAIWFQIFRAAEQLHYYAEEGMAEPRVSRGFERQLNEVSRLPGVQEWWAHRRGWFGDAFQPYIDTAIETGEPVEPQTYAEAPC